MAKNERTTLGTEDAQRRARQAAHATPAGAADFEFAGDLGATDVGTGAGAPGRSAALGSAALGGTAGLGRQRTPKAGE